MLSFTNFLYPCGSQKLYYIHDLYQYSQLYLRSTLQEFQDFYNGENVVASMDYFFFFFF